MELQDLNKDEKLAFVGLMELVLIADEVISDEEKEKLESVISKIGISDYRSLIYTYNKTFTSVERFKSFLLTIERQEARELIYGILYEIAQVDFVHSNESSILDWLAENWNLDVGYTDLIGSNGD